MGGKDCASETLHYIQTVLKWGEGSEATFTKLKTECDAETAKYAATTSDCDGKQDTFEGTFCEYAMVLTTTCDSQTKLRAELIALRSVDVKEEENLKQVRKYEF